MLSLAKASSASKMERFSAAEATYSNSSLPTDGVYPKTRVWGSKPENVHCSGATVPLRIELHWGCEESREKTAVGSGVSFKYDPFGRRIEKISPTTTSIFAYDGVNLIETVNSTGGVVARYTHSGGVDEPLAMQRGTTTDFYEADGLGSITSLTASNASIAQSYTYDSFGNTTTSSGSLTNFFRYTAREFDTETNLYFNRARYLDPSSGRFLSEDPIRFKGGNDFYSYVQNSPLDRTDPRGLCKDCPSGRWSGAGTNFGGILVMGGVFTGIYRVDCWGGNISCLIMTTCSGTGLGLGGSVTGESIWVSGAYSPSDLGGTTEGGVAGGGVGVVAAGGSGGSPPTNKSDPWYPSDPSNSSSYTYGAGVGLGGGYIAGQCSTTVLSCTHY
ncbi:MAG: RHS repeat-associated core domain-containing protein [Candidatus Acidiferrales bacterium]